MMTLERFRAAQNDPHAGFAAALDELRTGGKRGHWIWYVFPQIDGLGSSPQSQRFALHGEVETAAFLRDAELRSRYLTIASAVAEQLRAHPTTSLRTLMGSEIDAVKLVSSLTLFRHVARTLHARDAVDNDADYAAIVRVADEILTRAAGEGYPACAHTLRRLAR
jgi:uncharacterized protein (DUF1810 family)